MRTLLVAILINGLVPAFGEAAEAVVHYAKTGHVAHVTADEHDLGELGREHGCGAAAPSTAAIAARTSPWLSPRR